jgi:anti-sigma factor RsiW
MDCKKVQDFIITDYVDGQMGDKQKSLIDQHLSHCHACDEYLSIIKKEAIAPFFNASTHAPGKVLWAQIKESIQDQQLEQLEKSLQPNFWQKISSAVHIPRPAFALATFVTMIFMIGSTGQLLFNAPVMKINGQDQVEYLSSLINGPVDINSGNDTQTPIEKVFL